MKLKNKVFSVKTNEELKEFLDGLDLREWHNAVFDGEDEGFLVVKYVQVSKEEYHQNKNFDDGKNYKYKKGKNLNGVKYLKRDYRLCNYYKK